jgi:hypothetical protein
MKNQKKTTQTAGFKPSLPTVLPAMFAALMLNCSDAGAQSSLQSALVFVDGPMSSPYVSALTQMGLPFQQFGDESSFTAAVGQANPNTVLVIVDSYWGTHSLSCVPPFVVAGGRVILEYWKLSSGSTLATTFGASSVQPLSTATSVYDWGGSPLFTGLNNPVAFTDLFTSDGVRLQASAAGAAVAGFTASPTAYQAAIVVGNSNRTILTGFLIEEVSSSSVAAQLAQNEIEYLSAATGPPKITAQPQDQTVVSGATASFSVAASASPSPSYQWLFNATNVLAGATNSVLSLVSVAPAQGGAYCAVVTNIYGAVTSSPALLTVLPSGAVRETLLFVDGSQASVFETALTQGGQVYQRYNDLTTFSSALEPANPANTLAIADITVTYLDLSALGDFASRGGRAILECWNLASGPAAAAFKVSVSQLITAPPPLYDWGVSDLFAGLPNPVKLNNVFHTNGVMLQPLAGGTALAGFTAQPIANQAAIVLGNNGRTLVNGFLEEDISDSGDAVTLAANEIGCVCIETNNLPFFVGQPSPANVTVYAGNLVSYTPRVVGNPPLSFQWYNGPSPISGATSSNFTFAATTGTNHYSCVATNTYGATTSLVTTVIAELFVPPASGFTVNFAAAPNGTAANVYAGPGAYSDNPANTDTNWNPFAGTSGTPSGLATDAAGGQTLVTATLNFGFNNTGLAGSPPGTPPNGDPTYLVGAEDAVNGGAPGIGTSANPMGRFIINCLPQGSYSLYVYAENYDGDRGSVIALDPVNGGSPDQGIFATTNGIVNGLNAPHTHADLVEGDNYVFFHQVVPSPLGTISGTYIPNPNPISGNTGEAPFNGLQLALNFISLTRGPATGQVTVSWSGGSLWSAPSVTGPWTQLFPDGHSSPQTLSATGAPQYFLVW